jgi:cAMP-dependent protein kinase regulator
VEGRNAENRRDEGRRLRTEASEALRKGQLRKALARYQALEQVEPGDAQWCGRTAELHARLGEKAEQVEALARAAERHAAGGFLLRAVAVCKRILDLAPRHTATQERLAGLYAAEGRPAAPPLRIPVPESGPPLSSPALSEIVLDEVIEEAATTAGRVLPRVPLFCDLGPAAFARLVRAVRLVKLREDSVLFREGERGDALYVVVEGAVVPSSEHPVRRRLAVLQPGDFFGEVALITDQPRIATVRALVDTTLLVLDADAVRALIRQEPALRVVFLRFLRERLLHRLGQTSPLFRSLDAARFRQLASRFRFLDVCDGTELVAQGDMLRRFFVALCGRFEVSRHDGMEVRTLAWLELGDVFGEMSLLSGEPAMATITVRGSGFVLALQADAFDELAGTQPALVEGLRALAAEREAKNEASLGDLAGACCRRIDLV